jgi:hypothetical protein
VISGFLLESEFNENGQDAVERRMINQSIVPSMAGNVPGLAYPDGLFTTDHVGAGQSLFDNGVYNLGVTPIGNDVGRGGPDAFGWPLSLAAMMLKQLGGADFLPGNPLSTFTCSSSPCDPIADNTGGLFEETAQDQQINPGFETEATASQIPRTDLGFDYLAPFTNDINVGDSQPEIDEVFSGLNTLTDTAMLEGFLDTLGPFNPAGVLNEGLNLGESALMGSWPIVNRVSRAGSMKAPQLREIELTGPYFHTGGYATLEQVVDFYDRGGNVRRTATGDTSGFGDNSSNFDADVMKIGLSSAEKAALVAFLKSLTDDRVRYEKAPFDHPSLKVPSGHKGDNVTVSTTDGVKAVDELVVIPAVGAAGIATPIKPFLQ